MFQSDENKIAILTVSNICFIVYMSSYFFAGQYLIALFALAIAIGKLSTDFYTVKNATHSEVSMALNIFLIISSIIITLINIGVI